MHALAGVSLRSAVITRRLQVADIHGHVRAHPPPHLLVGGAEPAQRRQDGDGVVGVLVPVGRPCWRGWSCSPPGGPPCSRAPRGALRREPTRRSGRCRTTGASWRTRAGAGSCGSTRYRLPRHPAAHLGGAAVIVPRSHGAAGPGTTTNNGWTSGLVTPAWAAARYRLRAASFAARWAHSWATCPSGTGMRGTAAPAGAVPAGGPVRSMRVTSKR